MAVSITTTKIRRMNLGNVNAMVGKSVIAGDGATGDIDLPCRRVDIVLPITMTNAHKGIAINEDFPLIDTPATLLNESNNATTY